MYTFYKFGHRMYTFYDFLHSIQHIHCFRVAFHHLGGRSMVYKHLLYFVGMVFLFPYNRLYYFGVSRVMVHHLDLSRCALLHKSLQPPTVRVVIQPESSGCGSSILLTLETCDLRLFLFLYVILSGNICLIFVCLMFPNLCIADKHQQLQKYPGNFLSQTFAVRR